MTTIKNVTGTAFVVAEYRAEENSAAHPLYDDPIVSVFLNENTRTAAQRIAEVFPPVAKMVRLRTRYLDDQLERLLADGYRQVVILGAGLDTRAVRKSAPGVRYFEIDDASTLDYKKAQLAQCGVPDSTVYIAGNYATTDLIELLRSHGFDCNTPSYFIWEGNTMYLTEALVSQVLRNIAGQVREFTLSFDYMTKEIVENRTGVPAVVSLVETFARLGAPWTCGISDLPGLTKKAALSIRDQVKTSELYRRYWADCPLDSPIYEFYRLCTLHSGNNPLST